MKVEFACKLSEVPFLSLFPLLSYPPHLIPHYPLYACMCVCVCVSARPRYGHEIFAGTLLLATLWVLLWKTCGTDLFNKMFAPKSSSSLTFP